MHRLVHLPTPAWGGFRRAVCLALLFAPGSRGSGTRPVLDSEPGGAMPGSRRRSRLNATRQPPDCCGRPLRLVGEARNVCVYAGLQERQRQRGHIVDRYVAVAVERADLLLHLDPEAVDRLEDPECILEQIDVRLFIEPFPCAQQTGG